jgi:hypothetical protein
MPMGDTCLFHEEDKRQRRLVKHIRTEITEVVGGIIMRWGLQGVIDGLLESSLWVFGLFSQCAVVNIIRSFA